MKFFLKMMLPGILFVLLLVMSFVSFNNHEFTDRLSALVGRSFIGAVLFYVSVLIFTTVVAPISSIPLIPIASKMFGPFLTGVLNIAGWFIGAMIAFAIARYFSNSLLPFFASKEKIATYQNIIPRKHYFWSVVLLRMMMPVDFLSYVLGFLTSIPWKTYALATIIGITPFAFAYSYGGIALFEGNYIMLTSVVLIGAVVAVLIYLIYKRMK